ncbi:unnamed protein product [Rhizophagus irregularis]|nr:unnamed protein product [Rhizophagus irregularis]
MSLSSAWRSVVRIVKKVQDKAHNYPKLPAFPLVEEHLPFQIGNVFIVAMPLPVHAAVVSAPSHYDPSDNTYTLKTYADVTVSPHIAHLTVPINLRRPGPPPCDVEKNPHGRIFCEVAYTENLNFLHKKCTNWMLEGYVRYVLGIKIYERRKGSINRTLTARLYSRVAAPPTGPAATAVTTLSGVFYQEWDFGTVQFAY